MIQGAKNVIASVAAFWYWDARSAVWGRLGEDCDMFESCLDHVWCMLVIG